MKRVRFALTALALAPAALARADAQTARPPAPVPSPFSLTIDAATLAGLARLTLDATDEHGTKSTYGGVSLHDLVVRAGAPDGKALRGTAMTSVVIVGAADRYHAAFTLPEIDPAFGDRVVLLADQRDGAPLPANVGPYRLVVPFDKRDARWVHNVRDIQMRDALGPHA